MAIKVGINGFGRIGRMAFRAIAKDFPEIEVVGINDLLDPDYLAYMLKYDSVHGNFDGDIAVDGNTMIVNGKSIRLTAERDPANLAWGDVGAVVTGGPRGIGSERGGPCRPLRVRAVPNRSSRTRRSRPIGRRGRRPGSR